MFNFERLTDTTKKVIIDAQNIALNKKNPALEVIHVISAIKDSSEDVCVNLRKGLKRTSHTQT